MDRPGTAGADDRAAPAPEPRFDVVTDDGLDAFDDLRNDTTIVPFQLHFGDEVMLSTDLTLDQLFERMRSGGPHPTTSQPSPNAFAEVYRAAQRPLLVVTVSSALSGTLNSADQAKAMVPEADVTLHDSGTISAAQAFQVHAAMTARALGHDIATALTWMRRVHEQTELYFTVDSLEYLRRGGRIGRIQAAMGSVLDLKPIAFVDKATGAYDTVGRTRSWRKAIINMAKLAERCVPAGESVRVGAVRGEDRAEAEALVERIKDVRSVAWSGIATVGAALAIHTGPKAAAYAVAPAAWPWEAEGA